jgi:hypothetical protein
VGKGNKLKRRDDAQSKGKLLRDPVSPEIDNNKRCPDYCFHHMRNGYYSVQDCDEESRTAFIDGLWERSRLTWSQITVASRKGLGKEEISRASLKVTPPASISEDVTFIAMRIGDAARMLGFRDGSVFQIVWVAATHDLYS